MTFNLFVIKAVVYCILVSTSIRVATVTDKEEDEQFYHKNPMRQWPAALGHLRSTTSEDDQADAVINMIRRLLGNRGRTDFAVTVNQSLAENGHDIFQLENNPDRIGILITSSSGVAAAMGFQYYAKTYGGCHFSWSGDQVDTLTSPPPRLMNKVKVVSNDLFRYYQNVCTPSYSFVWWNWTRWEREIDWMALNGINLPLAFNSQETIWRRVYLALGFAQTDLDVFFAGPAFLAWNRMGNIDGWGGPLLAEYYARQLELQHLILARMRSFGMVPVLPAFSGHVPKSIKNYYPNVNVTQQIDWMAFGDNYSCTYLLDYTDPMFSIIGESFIGEMEKEFGVDHVYNCDTFNEMTPPSADPDYIAGIGRATYEAMITVDPQAIWLMQGWLFQNTWWNETLAKALLLSVPIGRMIVLDLESELHPLYDKFDSYFGQPWIWCMLHNYGAVKGLYGSVDQVNQGPFEGRAYPNSTMIGTGLTPEGIEQNDVMYELMNEMAYMREPVNIDTWFPSFAQRRYGMVDDNLSAAWIVMAHTVFNCSEFKFHGQYIVNVRPNFLLVWPAIYYPVWDFAVVWDLFINSSISGSTIITSDLYRHDLIDVSREALVVVATALYQKMQFAFNMSSSANFRSNSQLFLNLLYDLETLLATDHHFLLGPWLAGAKSFATNASHEELFEYNARNQITLWGPNGEIVDYATKQWSGVVEDYFLPRWQLFVDQAQLCLDSSKPFNETVFNEDVFNEVESPFTFDTKSYPIYPIGDAIETANQLYTKWRGYYPDSSQV